MAKIYITSSAIQNCGRQAVILASNVTTVSAGLPRYTALITPNKIPSGILIVKALSEKNKVMGIRSARTSTVLVWNCVDWPKSPCNASPSQLKYRMITG